jgi:ParB family chromosome partitioning protein
MQQKRSGLGRGLGALIPTEVASSTGASLVELPTGAIEPNRLQPREHFDEDTLASLTASVRELGVLQPILVRRLDGDRYELIAGERRWRAAKRAGLPTIPALVREIDDRASLEQALVENLHRQDLNALEEAAAYSQLMDDFHLTQEEVAKRVGKSRSAVANTLRLFHLPPSVQRLIAESRLSAGHARALLGTPDRAVQERLADEAVREGWSVREVEAAVRALTQPAPEEPGAPVELPGATPVVDEEPSSDADEPRPGSVREPAVLELEELLSARLDTRVNVSIGAKRGRIIVEFADLDDLERIYRIITPPGSRIGE